MKTIISTLTYSMSLVCLSALVLAGCAVGDADSDPILEEQPVFVTAAHTREDGTQEVRSMQWSRAELHAALRARIQAAAAAGVVIDPADVGLPSADEESATE